MRVSGQACRGIDKALARFRRCAPAVPSSVVFSRVRRQFAGDSNWSSRSASHRWTLCGLACLQKLGSGSILELGASARNSPLHSRGLRVSIATVDALARAYGPWWLCNDVTRPFWQSGVLPGPEREVDMVAIPSRAIAPCPDAALRGTRQRGRGGRVTDPSSLS